MNKDYRNLGIAFAVASVSNICTLSKIEIPTLDTYIYTLNSKDKSFEYNIDIEKDSNYLDSDEVLRTVLQKAYDKFTNGKEQLQFGNKTQENESIAKVFNVLKTNAYQAYAKWLSYQDKETREQSKEQKFLASIENAIMNIEESFYQYTDFGKNEFDVLEYMFSTFDLIYGESEINFNSLKTPVKPSDIDNYYKEASEFIIKMKDYDRSLSNNIGIIGFDLSHNNPNHEDDYEDEYNDYNDEDCEDYDDEDDENFDEYSDDEDDEEDFDEYDQESGSDEGIQKINDFFNNNPSIWDFINGYRDFLNNLHKNNDSDEHKQEKQDKNNDGQDEDLTKK